MLLPGTVSQTHNHKEDRLSAAAASANCEEQECADNNWISNTGTPTSIPTLSPPSSQPIKRPTAEPTYTEEIVSKATFIQTFEVDTSL